MPEKKVFLCFPNCRHIDLGQLCKTSIEVQGYSYTSKRHENEDSDVICYYPKPISILFYNSFLPIITVEESICSSGVVLRIAGKQLKTLRFALSFFYVVIGLLQCFLIKTYFDGLLENIFVGFIPVIAFVFLFSLSAIIKRTAIKIFATEFRMQVEKLIRAENDIGRR